MSSQAGVIERIWRYPVKSTGGELLASAAVGSRGLDGDRLWAVRDRNGKLGSGKNTRRFRRMDGLLELRSCWDGGERPSLTGPSGRPVEIGAYLSRDDVVIAREDEVSHFDQLPVSVLTSATLEWLRTAVPGVPVDERRLRPNVLLRTPAGTEPFCEDTWFGRTGRLGGVVLRFERSSERCAMTNMAQGDLPHSPLVLRAIATGHHMRMDALATVAEPGTIRLGDPLVLLT